MIIRSFIRYVIPGGLPAAIALVLLPVAMFLANAGFSLADEGQSGIPFPYFKVVIFFAIAGTGVLANLITVWLQMRKRRHPVMRT